MTETLNLFFLFLGDDNNRQIYRTRVHTTFKYKRKLQHNKIL